MAKLSSVEIHIKINLKKIPAHGRQRLGLQIGGTTPTNSILKSIKDRTDAKCCVWLLF